MDYGRLRSEKGPAFPHYVRWFLLLSSTLRETRVGAAIPSSSELAASGVWGETRVGWILVPRIGAIPLRWWHRADAAQPPSQFWDPSGVRKRRVAPGSEFLTPPARQVDKYLCAALPDRSDPVLVRKSAFWLTGLPIC